MPEDQAAEQKDALYQARFATELNSLRVVPLRTGSWSGGCPANWRRLASLLLMLPLRSASGALRLGTLLAEPLGVSPTRGHPNPVAYCAIAYGHVDSPAGISQGCSPRLPDSCFGASICLPMVCVAVAMGLPRRGPPKSLPHAGAFHCSVSPFAAVGFGALLVVPMVRLSARCGPAPGGLPPHHPRRGFYCLVLLACSAPPLVLCWSSAHGGYPHCGRGPGMVLCHFHAGALSAGPLVLTTGTESLL